MKKLLQILGILLVSLLLLEGMLQVLAFGVFLSSKKRPSENASGVRKVLCLGDSFTYGFGSSKPEFSYPGRLQSRLDERGGETWEVVNCGYPGKNSAEMLQSLDYLLEQHAPEFVILLSGANDTWSKPKRVDLNTLDASSGVKRWQWKLRTLRLAKTLRRSNAFESDSAEPSPDSLTSDEPPEELSVAPAPAAETPEAESETGFAPDGRPLDFWTPELDAQNHKNLRLKQESLDALAEGRLNEAEALLQQISDLGEAERVGGLIAVYCAQGRRDQVGPLLDDLRAIAAKPELIEHEATTIAGALTQSAFFEEGVEMLESFTKTWPNNFEMAFFLSIFYYNLDGRMEEACAESDRALALMDLPIHANHWGRHWFLRTRGNLYGTTDIDSKLSAEALVRFQLESGDSLSTIRVLDSCFAVTSEIWADASDRLATSPEQKKMLAGVFAESQSQGDGDKPRESSKELVETLEFHIQSIVERSQNAGASVILSTYPFVDNEIAGIQAKTAKKLGIVLVRNDKNMSRLLEEADHDRSVYFIGDGHCNDKGYDVMAGEIYKALVGVIDEDAK